MKFHEFGDKNLPPILLIHGGGSSWWNYLRQARILSEKYRVILPTLNGHGEENQLDYVSTEDSALKILDYIKANCGGKLFAIGGVSLGGQIAMELLSLDSEIAEKAIIDGSLCIPQPRLAKISIFLVSLFGKLMFNKFSCKLQLSMMNKLYPKLAYPEEIKAYYLEDLPRTPIKTLVTIYKTYMGRYKLKDTISASKAQVMYICGEKELNCVKESAKLFHQLNSNTILYEAKGYNHGYLSSYRAIHWECVMNLICNMEETDANDLFQYASNPEVGPIAGWPVHASVENSKEIIKSVFSAPETYAIVLKETMQPVCSIGLMIGSISNIGIPDNEGEIGYWIGVPYWGQGLIPEAVREIVRHGFDNLNLEKLWCGYLHWKMFFAQNT